MRRLTWSSPTPSLRIPWVLLRLPYQARGRSVSLLYNFLLLPSCSLRTLFLDPIHLICVRPDMRYCFRSGRRRPNPNTKHISVPPRHMTKSYIPDFNMISQHYRYKDTTSHTNGIQVPEYNTTTEDTCL